MIGWGIIGFIYGAKIMIILLTDITNNDIIATLITETVLKTGGRPAR